MRLKHQFTHSQIYDYFSHAGIDYGQFYRNLNTIHSNRDEVLAEIIISDENKRASTSNLHLEFSTHQYKLLLVVTWQILLRLQHWIITIQKS